MSRMFIGVWFGGLTFDMRGGRKWAKPACGRPLDGRVRALFDDMHRLTFRAVLLGASIRHRAWWRNSRTTRSVRLLQWTDCPAQHGGAKRQHPTDSCGASEAWIA